MGNLIKVLLQISSRLRRWKNFENRSVFDEVMPKILLVPFFSGHGVYPKFLCIYNEYDALEHYRAEVALQMIWHNLPE